MTPLSVELRPNDHLQYEFTIQNAFDLPARAIIKVEALDDPFQLAEWVRGLSITEMRSGTVIPIADRFTSLPSQGEISLTEIPPRSEQTFTLTGTLAADIPADLQQRSLQFSLVVGTAQPLIATATPTPLPTSHPTPIPSPTAIQQVLAATVVESSPQATTRPFATAAIQNTGDDQKTQLTHPSSSWFTPFIFMICACIALFIHIYRQRKTR